MIFLCVLSVPNKFTNNNNDEITSNKTQSEREWGERTFIWTLLFALKHLL